MSRNRSHWWCRPHASDAEAGAHPPDAFQAAFMGNWPFCLFRQPGPSCIAPVLSSKGLNPVLMAGTLGGLPGEARLSRAIEQIKVGRV